MLRTLHAPNKADMLAALSTPAPQIGAGIVSERDRHVQLLENSKPALKLERCNGDHLAWERQVAVKGGHKARVFIVFGDQFPKTPPLIYTLPALDSPWLMHGLLRSIHWARYVNGALQWSPWTSLSDVVVTLSDILNDKLENLPYHAPMDPPSAVLSLPVKCDRVTLRAMAAEQPRIANLEAGNRELFEDCIRLVNLAREGKLANQTTLLRWREGQQDSPQSMPRGALSDEARGRLREERDRYAAERRELCRAWPEQKRKGKSLSDFIDMYVEKGQQMHYASCCLELDAAQKKN